MSLRVNANPLSIVNLNQLKQNDDSLSKSISRLSSGLRIERTGDDTAGRNISERMRAQVRGLDQAASNATDAHNMLGTAEGALDESHATLQRMRELAVQGASDTLTVSDRTSIKQELDNLSAEVQRIGTKTEWNDRKLLDGGTYASLFTIQVGAMAGDIHTFGLSNMQSVALNVGTTQISVDTTANASTTIANLDRAIDAVNTQRAYLGAKMNALAQNIQTLSVQSENIGSSENKIRDVDFAKEASKMTRAQLLQQSSTAMLAQSNAQPQAVLGLLRLKALA